MYQPLNSNLCGQTCVAMIANIPLETSIKLFKTKGKTTTKQFSEVLNNLGFLTARKLVKINIKNKKSKFCIVKLHFSDSKNTHWVVWKDGLYYDPELGITKTYDNTVRETSYLQIFRQLNPN